jgi:FAD dependent monooxygenase
MQKPNFRVIIVGGSVSGQTLALALEMANIDYILLEKYDTFAPEVGASIGMFANGMRILDQLGVVDEIESKAEPQTLSFMRDEKGHAFSCTELNSKLADA